MNGIFTPQDDADDRDAYLERQQARADARRAEFVAKSAELAKVGDDAVKKLAEIFGKGK